MKSARIMTAARSFAIAVAFGLVAVSAWAQSVVIFQWTDDEGRQHYTNNFNQIPEPFRKTTVKGVFVPDAASAPAKPKCENEEPLVETNYYVKAGNLHVEGSLTNGFKRSISYVKLKVSFFDTQDRFVRAESTFIDPLELAPCGEGRFSVVTPQTDDVSYFKTEYTYK
ncbi:MAG: DUF4124 domain-containing protein [Deltaproteobacteria bacterium]|nr:DUF4124 domain-containing protein [Deltaproteobacteria bacterium]